MPVPTRGAFLIGALALVLAAAACQSQEEETPGNSAMTAGAEGRIAFVSNRDGNDEIYLINADGSGLTNLTNNPNDDALNGDFSWSPDGERIAFTSLRDGAQDIYVINVADSRVARLTTGGERASPPGPPTVSTWHT